MNTRILTVEGEADRLGVAGQAADELNRGGIVVFPTETVYGIGVRADIAEAVARLRELKSRPADKAFTVHIAMPAGADGYASPLSPVAQRLRRRAWPGPLTLILPVDDPARQPRMASLDADAVASMVYDGSIGLRCPNDRLAQAILKGAEGPVVAASANKAQRPPPRSMEEVLRDFDGHVDLVVDGGTTQYANASTIVRITGNTYEIVRTGVYDARIIREFAAFRLLFVCTGNTCRSPMAGALARNMLARKLGCAESELAARGIEVLSAGTAGEGGRAAEHAVSVMRRRNLDLSDHVSRALTPDMIEKAAEILVMTQGHRQAVISMVPSAEDRVRLLLGDREINDPVGGSEADYEFCAQTLTQGIAARLDEITI